jgi:hypothetical protein
MAGGGMPNSETFSTQLRERLRKKYGRLPSAAFVAIHFNRQNSLERPISQETARRWMRGVSMPSYQHLSALSTWLAVDVNQILVGDAPKPAGSALTEKVEYSEDTIRLAELLSSLPSNTQSLLLNIVSNLRLGYS